MRNRLSTESSLTVTAGRWGAGDGDSEAACPDGPGSRLQVLSHCFVHVRLILSWTSANQNEKKETALLGRRHAESPLLCFLDPSGFTAPVLVGVMPLWG